MNDFFKFKPVLTDDYFHGKPLVIDHTPQMLFGDIMVEDTWRIKSESECPEFVGTEPVLCADQACERGNMYRPSVIYDEDDGLYKIWYGGGAESHIYYAESKDGLHWEKPALNLIHTEDYGDNNIVIFTDEVKDGKLLRQGHHELGRVILNPDRSDIDRKFIMVICRASIEICFSPDGIHWTPIPERPAGIMVDCTINLMYDESRNMWQIYARPSMYAKDERIDWHHQRDIYPNGVYRRDVCLFESPDLIRWSAPRIIYRPEETFFRQEADNISFFSVGNYSAGFIHHFTEINEHDSYVYGGSQQMFPYLVYGSDTKSLKMAPDKKCLIPKTVDGADPISAMMPGTPMHIKGDENTYFFASVNHRTNQVSQPANSQWEGKLYLMRFNGNRFLARTGDYFGGWLLTRQFILDGSEIEIDAIAPEDTKFGEVRCEIVGEDGAPIDGFAFADSDPVTGDSFHHKLTWKGSSDISALRGKAVYLRFLVVASKIYSFTVKE